MYGASYYGQGYYGSGYVGGQPVVLEDARLYVEVGLSGVGGPLTDISGDLTDDIVRIQRAFQTDDPDDLVMAPPTAAFALRNDANNVARIRSRYSPDSGFALSGWQESDPIRIWRIGGVTARLRFVGFIDQIAPDLGLYEGQTVPVTATGWLDIAASILATGVVAQINQRGDQLTQTLAGLAQYAPAAISAAAGADTYPYSLHDLDPVQSTVMDGFDSVTKSGLDRIYEKADGTLVFEPRSVRTSAPASFFTLTDVAPAGQPGFALAYGSLQRSKSTVYNRVTVTGHPSSVSASPVVLYSYPTSASTPSIDASGTPVVIRAPYIDPAQLAQQIGGTSMLISDGAGGAVVGVSGLLPLADYKFTSAPNGGGSDLSSQVAVSVVYEARQATFTIVNGSGVPVYYALLQCRGTAIYNYVPAVGTGSNSLSRGGRTLSIDCPYQVDQNFIQGVASYLATSYGVSVSRFDQPPGLDIPAADFATADQCLGVDISDPITIAETMSGIAAVVWIDGFTEQYDARCNLKLTWAVSRRRFINTWHLGTPGQTELGQTTVLKFF